MADLDPKKKKLRRPIKKPDNRRSEAAISARLEKAAKRLDPAEGGPSVGTLQVRTTEVRQQAAIDYITDSESRSVEWWWNNEDRSYKRIVAFRTFKAWSDFDQWISRRERFWQEIEERVLMHKQHQILIQRLKEIDLITEGADAMREWLLPLRDKSGKIRRHAPEHEDGKENILAGLPMFALEMPDFDKFVKMYIEMDRLLMLKRGEVTGRTETVPPGERPLGSLDPVGSKVAISKEEARELAKVMLRLRQPELSNYDLDSVIIVPQDTDEETEEGDDDGKQ